MRSMSYGELPSFREFIRAFEHIAPSGYFRIRLSRSDARAVEGIIGDDDYTVNELWVGVNRLTEEWSQGNDPAGDLASSILSILEFEWI